MRINEIVKFINNCNVIVDVGSDHALFSKLIIDNKLANVVYNIEKNLGPFNNSKLNTSEPKYKDKIINILSDGFSNFDTTLKIDYCVISGIGGSLIVDIISKCQNQIDYFLLCPNNNESTIREWAKLNKYKIVEDNTIFDNGIYYEILLLSKIKGKRILFKNQLFFGIRSIKKYDILFIDKLKFDYKRLIKNFDMIEKFNKSKLREINKIKRYIFKYENKRCI
ncbi:MAG: tRNA (adenine(22)-N(1))-methyltransferase TrmK [Malacoplasma sp.]